MVFIDEPLLVASSAEKARSLVTTTYNKLVPKVMIPFAIVSAQPDTLTVDEHRIQNTVSTDRATFSPGNETPTNTSECLLIKE